MLIAPNFPWHRADSPEEQLALSKEFGLTPKSYVHPKPLIYRDMDGNIVPCTLVGRQSGRYAIIEIGDALHTIHADCLADMQGAARTRRTELRATRPVYTVIDIETTGLDRGTAEIIEFGALRVENGTPTERFSLLVQPSAPVPPVCAELTGITDEMLAGQPSIREALPAFLAFVGKTPLVGQNLLDFDLPIINRVCKEQGVPPLDSQCCDTLLTARSCLRLPGYKLEALAAALHVPQSTAHRALGDCETTHRVFEALVAVHPVSVRWSRPTAHQNKAASPSAPRPRVTAKQLAHYQSRPKAKEIVPATGLFDPAHPLFGKTCVLTGELVHMSDRDAMQRIADCGGLNADNVTKKTDLLIVGGGSSPARKSGKVTKAEDYIERGIPIRILTEEEFEKML